MNEIATHFRIGTYLLPLSAPNQHFYRYLVYTATYFLIWDYVGPEYLSDTAEANKAYH